jgi:hypothetical protein
MHVFLQIFQIRVFAAKRAYFHLKTLKLLEVLLSNIYSILTGKQCAKFYCFSHTRVSFKTYMCFFNLAEKDYLK